MAVSELASIPKWAPEGLRELYASRIDFLNSVERMNLDYLDVPRKDHYVDCKGVKRPVPSVIRLQILHDLITHEQMRLGWAQITKQAKEKKAEVPCHPPHLEVILYHEICDMYFDSLEQIRERETLDEKRRRYEDIARAAKVLAGSIKNSNLNTAIHRYFPPDILAMYIAKADPEIPDHNPLDYWYLDDKLKQLRLRPEWEERREDLIAHYDRLYPNYYHPSVSNTLGYLAEAATEVASETLAGYDFLPYPRIANAQRVYFIRRLARLFEFWFKQKLQGTVAKFASVVLDQKELYEDPKYKIVSSAFRKRSSS